MTAQPIYEAALDRLQRPQVSSTPASARGVRFERAQSRVGPGRIRRGTPEAELRYPGTCASKQLPEQRGPRHSHPADAIGRGFDDLRHGPRSSAPRTNAAICSRGIGRATGPISSRQLSTIWRTGDHPRRAWRRPAGLHRPAAAARATARPPFTAGVPAPWTGDEDAGAEAEQGRWRHERPRSARGRTLGGGYHWPGGARGGFDSTPGTRCRPQALAGWRYGQDLRADTRSGGGRGCRSRLALLPRRLRDGGGRIAVPNSFSCRRQAPAT